jgi:hypothetical protein
MIKRIDPEENLVKLFGSVPRARILNFLYAFEGQSFYQREIIYESGLVLWPVQRELENLASLGLVKFQKTRNKFIMRSTAILPSSSLSKRSAD